MGRELDPVVGPLCHAHHGGPRGVHARLRGLGLDGPAPTSAVAGVELALRRLAVFLDGVAEARAGTWTGPLLVAVAEVLDRLAEMLRGTLS